MKITVKNTTERVVELPKYFKNANDALFMLCDNGMTYIKVYDCMYEPSLGLIPYIKVESNSVIKYDAISGFQPISEAEFKAAYLRVSVIIDEIFNN